MFGIFVVLAAFTARADDFSALCAQRLAIERVYYAHRLGTKPPFEQVMPLELVEKLEREELQKENLLRETYGVQITPAMLEAEVKRINTTTRAPDVLAELKAALNNNTQSFARLVARPIVVERELRARFDNDARLSAPQRAQIEKCRNDIVCAQKTGRSENDLLALLRQIRAGEFREVTWQLVPHRKQPASPAPNNQAPSPVEANASSSLYSIRGTIRFAQEFTAADSSPRESKYYFEDLAPELQRVLRVQLQKPGDVSAVIEMPTVFLLFLATETTDTTLSAATLRVPKQSLEQWLAGQSSPGHTAVSP